MGLRSSYQGFTRQRTSVELEHYRPPGQDGIAVTVRYAGKLSPEGVKRWRPMGRTAAVVGDHIRKRIRQMNKGPTGSKLGPGELSGGMWRGLAASVTAKGKARVYFKGSSVSYRRKKGGGITPRLDKDGRQVKVKNADKALNVSGMGMTVERDEKGRMQHYGDLKDRVRYGMALIPKGFEPPRGMSGLAGGVWAPWPSSVKNWRDRQKARQVPQRFASGKHSPVSILEPSQQEATAIVSVLGIGVEKLALAGGKGPFYMGGGDARLVSKLRRGLGV